MKPMKKIWLAGIGGVLAGMVVSTQWVGPIVAQETESNRTV